MAEIIETLDPIRALADFEANRQRLAAANKLTATEDDELQSVAAKVEATRDAARALEDVLMDLEDDADFTDELRDMTLKVSTAFYRQRAHLDALRRLGAASVADLGTVYSLLTAARAFPAAPGV
jgi:flagellar motor switch/type III secretory pathway protein FliN